MSIELPQENAVFFKKKLRLPWIFFILPVVLFVFLIVESLFLLFLEHSVVVSLPSPNIVLNEVALPQALCPTKQENPPQCFNNEHNNESLLRQEKNVSLVRIEKLPQKAHNTQALSEDFFEKGKTWALQKNWTNAALAFQSAFLYFPHADYAFNAALALEYLQEKQAAKLYYEKAHILAKEQNVQFSIAQLENRLKNWKN